MPNPYEIPEEPYYMMDELIEAFKSKSLVVCHMHRQLTIDALTSHGYFKRVNPSEDDIEAFKRAGSGKHLPSAFKYPSLPDNDVTHYNFYEVTIAGRTAVHYHFKMLEQERVFKAKLQQLRQDLTNDITNRIKSLGK